jgi:hypothetical protein
MQIINYLASLVITITSEICVAILFGYRTESALRAVILVNLITHPILGYMLWINAYEDLIDMGVLVAILEVLVVFVEWGLLYFVLRERPRRLLCLSLAANASSFGIGLVFFWP